MHGADVREAYKVTPGYKLNNPWFEYHEDDGLYYRFQYGGPHMGNEGQIAVKNLIIQYCPAPIMRPLSTAISMCRQIPGAITFPRDRQRILPVRKTESSV